MKRLFLLTRIVLLLMLAVPLQAKKLVVKLAEAPYYFTPDNAAKDNASRLHSILLKIQAGLQPDDKVVVKLAEGRYNFYPTDAVQREYYVSNHDQEQPKQVGICLENWHNLTLDGNGAELIFHGQMLPIAVVSSSQVTLRNFSIDFENPHIAQVEVIESKGDSGIVFRVEPWVKCRVNGAGRFETYGENWHYQPNTGIAFEKESRHIVYNTSDLWIDTKNVVELDSRLYYAPNWRDKRLLPSTIVAMRSWNRPAPGIFLDHCGNLFLNHVTVHYAEGMGLLAQRCVNVFLEHFNVCLKPNDLRYFTTQADATHFSQCRGVIQSEKGIYEAMMDDAINVHGIYLKVTKRVDDYTLCCRYEHAQAWGFAWGDVGDEVSFVKAKTMDILPYYNQISDIKPYDKEVMQGAKEFLICFKNRLPAQLCDSLYGIENLTWTPEVIFRHNVVRNNRARGALFSSPQKTICENNLFDHTSGAAILLCGDCNGWYESGAVRQLIIRKNCFINALTNMFQFTNAVVSIYPEIPDLEAQKSCFHGGEKASIRIEKNCFVTFDHPLLYAKSVNGVRFRNNRLVKNHDYSPFHWNQKPVLLEKVENAEIKLPKISRRDKK